MIGGLCVTLFYGINPLTHPELMSDTNNPKVVSSLLVLQTFSALGLFVFPVLAAAFLFDKHPLTWLRMKKTPSFYTVVLVVAVALLSAPLINWLGEINQHLSLPNTFKNIEDWMKSAEDKAAELTKVFLQTDTYMGLIVNLLVIALLPAIGEELLFRGAIQRLLASLSGNIHVGIVLSAIAFSALHMQFYGFLPRMMLGIYFGYLVLWTGSLWPAIIGHFINNALAIILFFLQEHDKLSVDPDTIGTKAGDEWILTTGIILTVAFVWMIYRINKSGVTAEAY